MRPFTQAFNDAIRATDREIRGYLEFNNDSTKRMYGDDGLIQFVVHQPLMSDQRYEVGSCNSFYCEASFFNSGIPAGVSLANSYFSANVGVKVYPSDGDTFSIVPSQNFTVSDNTAHKLTGVDFSAIENGVELTVNVNGTDYTVAYNLSGFYVDLGTSEVYRFSKSGSDWYFAYVDEAYIPELIHNGTYTVSVSVPAYEYKNLGWFYISEISRVKETTSVVAYDVINKMAGKYVPTVTKSASGYLAKDILNDIIDQSGIQNGTHLTSSTFNFYVPEIVDATMRETWGWLMACAYSSTRPGSDSFGSQQSLGNAAMRSYSQAVSDQSLYNYPTITDNEIYMDGLEVGDTFTISSFTTGTQENPIVKGSGVGINSPNPYITDAQATDMYNGLNGVSYTPMTLHWRGDPCIAPFDLLTISTDGNTYTLLTMNLVNTFNGGFEQTIESFGDSEAYYEMSYSPMEAKIQTNNTLIKDIAQAIETARGGVISQILDADGTWSELVIANSQDLSTATSVWRFNINGLAHSNRYSGGTYTFALDDQGRIVATLIQTGILQDALGNNYWNLDTGAFQITNGTINITTTSSTDNRVNLQYSSSSTVSWMNQMSPYNLFVSSRNGSNYYNTNYMSGGSSHDYYVGGTLASNLVLQSSFDYSSMKLGSATRLTEATSDGYYIKSRTNWGTATTRGFLNENGLTFYNASGTQTALYPSGGLTYYGGTAITSNVPSGTATNVRSVSLPAGRYIIWANIAWPNNSTGRREACIGTYSGNVTAGAAWDFRNAVSGDGTRQSLSAYVTTSAQTTYYLVLYQNSGSTLAMSAYGLYAIKLP